jgi:ribosomal protein S18 acetylase RimI-like enzyme
MLRRGVGRALVGAAGRLCEGRVELKCQSNNRPAMAFYRRLGFVVDGSGVSDMGPWVLYRSP